MARVYLTSAGIDARKVDMGCSWDIMGNVSYNTVVDDNCSTTIDSTFVAYGTTVTKYLAWDSSTFFDESACAISFSRRGNSGCYLRNDAPNKACSGPTRPSDTLPKYDIEIRVGIQGALVVFGEGLASDFLCSQAESTPAPARVNANR